ncbi:diguanylate cyclase [Beggiatoa leptomitoformis]|uniref:diguanylate cyclase n=1 Tax=Beggiatoa leptomitoformis TaxID=288004 RepID=A0A2N9YGZ0_9GAMM|nr:PleD family two-component system response regulator [Beggiatoa leptomitoformis]ALG67935.1 diguanylate cyclase [Beggiatoa leptomitoformis]AUI69792.1 diguanylate cyclase [Beggiatoa leptomitoformis]
MDTPLYPLKTEINYKDNILIIDDTLPNLRLLSNMLTEQGYKVRGVTNGNSALIAIHLSLPDLVLLDINIPDINGYEVCERLKADEKTRDIPVIFISAMHDILDKVKAFSIGGVDYITKPFHVDEVLARVRTHLTIRHLQKRLELANQELYRQATLDGLTQIANRRRFDSYLEQMWQQMMNLQKPIALILADIDYFKTYNDTYGHLMGDECLKKVAKTIEGATHRATDLAARYGGEEFAVILPETDITDALQVAETIQDNIKLLAIPHTQSTVSHLLTLSIGVTCMIPSTTNNNVAIQLIRQADALLYQAKSSGRNRIRYLTP